MEGLSRSGDNTDVCMELQDKRAKILPSDLQNAYNWDSTKLYGRTDFSVKAMFITSKKNRAG